MRSHLLFAVLATAATLGAAATARAEVLPPGYDQITTTVHIGDLNLNSDAGAQKALARIAHAASHVCGEVGNNVDLAHRTRYRTCVGQTVKNTVADLDSSRVNGLYANRGSIVLASYRGD